MSAPSNPTLVTRVVTPSLITFSLPFLRFNRIKMGGRATLVTLSSGSLAIFSPVALSPEVKETIQSTGNGQIRYIIAPDIEHHMHIQAYKSAFPSAMILAPEGLREKRAKSGSYEDVIIDYEFTTQNKASLKLPEDFAHDFDVEYFDGHANKEIVLLHKPTRTLIEADLLFNMPAHEQYSRSGESATRGMLTKLFLHFTGTNVGSKGQQRFIWYALAKNKESFGKSVRTVASWQFDRIIPCHGDVIETGGNDVFRRMFAWHL